MAMSGAGKHDDRELRAMGAALKALRPLEPQTQTRALRWLGEMLGLPPLPPGVAGSGVGASQFQAQPLAAPAGSAKAFVVSKKPTTDVERAACLAFYFTQTGGNNRFKTRDLTKLNTDAQLPRFSNPSVVARNAVNAGLFALAGGGYKMLTPGGEAYVGALPDRAAARVALDSHALGRRRRGRKRGRARASR